LLEILLPLDFFRSRRNTFSLDRSFRRALVDPFLSIFSSGGTLVFYPSPEPDPVLLPVWETRVLSGSCESRRILLLFSGSFSYRIADVSFLGISGVPFFDGNWCGVALRLDSATFLGLDFP